jgi:hypothetical protein
MEVEQRKLNANLASSITILCLVRLELSKITQKQQKEENIVNLVLECLLVSLDFLIAAALGGSWKLF